MKAFNLLQFLFRFFFDAFKSPAYEIVYALNFVSLGCTLIGLVAIDTFFVNLCFQVTACLKDLCDMISESGVQTSGLFESSKETLKPSMDFHNDIYELITDMQFLKPILFTQYLGSTFVLCTCIFNATVVNLFNCKL